MTKPPVLPALWIVWVCLGTSHGQNQPIREKGEARASVPADVNRDGWDDKWHYRFPDTDLGLPGLDSDHDGKSNYEEMLDFTDPHRPGERARILSDRETVAATRLAESLPRATDDEKRLRFSRFLKSRGAMEQGTKIAPPPPPLPERDPNLPVIEPAMKIATGDSPSLPETKAVIVALERLANGQTLLAWKGDEDRLSRVEFTSNPDFWAGSGSAAEWLPTIAGIGTWGERCFHPCRFYRMVPNESSATERISDPEGGDGISDYGGWIEVDENGVVTIHDHSGFQNRREVSDWDLHVDGQRVDLTEAPEPGKLAIDLNRISAGRHIAHASLVVAADSPDTGSSIFVVLRTPEITFFNPKDGFKEIGVTEQRISTSGGIRNATSSTIWVEHPAFEAGKKVGYAFRIRDGNNDVVREFRGTADGTVPETLHFDWDRKDDRGKVLPGGTYDVGFVMDTPGLGPDAVGPWINVEDE